MREAIVDRLTEALAHPTSDAPALITRLADEILAVVELENASRKITEIVEKLVPAIEAALEPKLDPLPAFDVEPEPEVDSAINEAPIDTLIAKHRGGGSYSILRNGVEVVEGLKKVDAEAFNVLSYADRQAFIAGLNKP